MGPREASERLDDRLAMEMGLLEGVEPRLDEKDMVVDCCVVAALVDVVDDDRYPSSRGFRCQSS